MKNLITQLSLVIIGFVALSLLMSYTRPAADGPKQYMVAVTAGGPATSLAEKLAADVNAKLAEGWRPQGGAALSTGAMTQTMVK